MGYKAYGFNIRKEDYELIRRMARVVTNEPIDVYDLRSYECNPKPDDVVFLFGQRAANQCKDKDVRAKLEFSDISRLDPALGHETPERLEATEILSEAKSAIDSDSISSLGSTKKKVITAKKAKKNSIKEENLPSLSTEELKSLEQSLIQRGIEGWKGITKSGKSIYLSVSPKENSDTDITMTFSELYATKTLMDTLDVQELEIVYKPSTSSEKDTLK